MLHIFYTKVLPNKSADCNSFSLFELPAMAANEETLKKFFGKTLEEISPTQLLNHYRSAATIFFLSYIAQKPLPETFNVTAHVEREEKKGSGKEEVKTAEITLLIKSKLKIPVLAKELKLKPEMVLKIETLFFCGESRLLRITNLKLCIEDILLRLKEEFGEAIEASKTKEVNPNLIPNDEVYFELVR